jgi:hypothetical protein
MKDGKTILQNLMKVHGIPQSFSWSKTFGFYEILYRITSLMNKISCFTSILQILAQLSRSKHSPSVGACIIKLSMAVISFYRKTFKIISSLFLIEPFAN